MPSESSVLQDHFLRPRNRRLADAPDAVGFADMGGSPPRMIVALNFSDDVLLDASFGAVGCGYLIACGSACTEMIKGLTIVAAAQITPQDVDRYLGGLPVHRQFCADLVVRAVRDALARRRG